MGEQKKLALLWQSYTLWDEFQRSRIRHGNRLNRIEAGKSTLDANYEIMWLETLAELEDKAKKEMMSYGEALAGPIWDALLSVRGIAAHTAAKFLALYDDVAKFDNISSFWRYGGLGRYPYWFDAKGNCMGPKDGYIELKREDRDEPKRVFKINEPKDGWELRTINDRMCTGWCRPYHPVLKKEYYLVMGSFMKSHSPYYVLYCQHKDYQREKHPNAVCKRCGAVAGKRGQSWHCTECSSSGFGIQWTDGHVGMMARRYAEKRFAAHFWTAWRICEGLPVTEPYVIDVLGHETMDDLAEFGWEVPEMARGEV